MIYGIFGHHTGGTSAVAGVVKIHGIPMWGAPRTLDDNLLEASVRYGNEAELIAERGDGWAFKHPLIPNVRDLVIKYDICPIYVYRDPVAIWMNSGKVPTREKIQRSAVFYTELADAPAGLYISYEKLLTDKEKVCRVIADYIGKPFNPRCLEWVNNDGTYKKVADYIN